MTTPRRLLAAPHVNPSGLPKAGTKVSVRLVRMDTRQGADAWVVASGERVHSGPITTIVAADGSWFCDLVPNDQMSTQDGQATGWEVKVIGYGAAIVQIPTGAGSADFYDLATAQIPLTPVEIAALATHMSDSARHLPSAGGLSDGYVLTIVSGRPAWEVGGQVEDVSNYYTTTAGEALGGNRVACISAGQAFLADKDSIEHASRFCGVTVGASAFGELVTLRTRGEMTEPSWAWLPDMPVYLGANGMLTQSPTASGFLLIVGMPTSSTSLFIDFGDAIFL